MPPEYSGGRGEPLAFHRHHPKGHHDVDSRGQGYCRWEPARRKKRSGNTKIETMTSERKVLVVAIVLGAVAIASFIFFMAGGLEMFMGLLPDINLVLAQAH